MASKFAGKSASRSAPARPSPQNQRSILSTRAATINQPKKAAQKATAPKAPAPAPRTKAPAIPAAGIGIKAPALAGGSRAPGGSAKVTSRPVAQPQASKANVGGQQGVNAFGGYSGSTGDFGGGEGLGGAGDMSLASAMAQEPAAPPPPTEDEYVAQDGTYTSQKGALDAILATLNTDLDAQGSDYQTTFDKNLKDLGWLGENQWNKQDTLTGYGAAFRGNQNDFSSRGMFDSSGYAQSLVDMDRGFNDQVAGMNTARQGFQNDIKRQRESGASEHTANLARARADALARYAMEYGL